MQNDSDSVRRQSFPLFDAKRARGGGERVTRVLKNPFCVGVCEQREMRSDCKQKGKKKKVSG